MTILKPAKPLIATLAATLILAACNGDGGNGEPASQPPAAGNPPTAGAVQTNGVNGAFSGKLFYEYAGEYIAFDLASGKPQPYLQEDTNRYSFSISADGKAALVGEQLTTGSREKEAVHRYLAVDTATGKTLGTYPGSPGSLSGMAMKLSPDGEYIATGLFRYQWGKAHIVVEDSNGNLLFDFTAAGFDDAFGWLPDGRMVAADANGWLTLFDRNFNQVKRIRQFSGPSLPSGVQASPDGGRLAFLWNDRIHVMNLDGSGLRQVTTSDLWQSGAAWSPDGKYLVITEAGGGSAIYAQGSAPCPLLRIVSADESMVDVGYLSKDPRSYEVKGATGRNGELLGVCARRVSWRN
ncbi:MAG: hypothetical protein EKK59_08225 [Neisseriaceae bacterium]|nr:MAG: hypothetical protein EKK59_08225 [Neisseriaceae bacterium]